MTDTDSYLDAMGIIQWQSREEIVSDGFIPDINIETVNVEDIDEVEILEEQNLEASKNEVTHDSSLFVSGLYWLSQGSTNGLLVVLPENRRNLNPEQRSLMSKMLKSIDFSPKETGFATILESTTITDKPTVSLNGIHAILAFGQDAGAALVQICGAKNVNGTDIFSLSSTNIICTLHPQDLLAEPSLKQQAWKDLNLLTSFIKNNH